MTRLNTTSVEALIPAVRGLLSYAIGNTGEVCP